MLADKERIKRNIKRMQQKAAASGALFRPHFKTHQSAEVGKMFRREGVRCITVSSLEMAASFALAGWRDITVAFPLNLREMDMVNVLAPSVRLNVLVEDAFVAGELTKKASANLGVMIKIDTGYHRTGIAPDDFPKIDAILSVLQNTPMLHFKGFLTHAGHTYHAAGKEEMIRILENAKRQLLFLKEKYSGRFPGLMVSYGDTPSCSVAGSCQGFDEIRPGNFVYYDVMQYHLGACSLEDIAVAVACPVVALHPERSQMVVYGGAVHLSKEFIAADNGFRLYGYVVRLNDDYRWGTPLPGAYVSSLSQEHGVVTLPQKEMAAFKPGDLVGLLPVHSCLTAHLLKNHTMLV